MIASAAGMAKREIAENIAIGKRLISTTEAGLPTEKRQQMEDRMEPQIDVANAMDRVAAIQKATGSSYEGALLRLSSSRALDDQLAWLAIKHGSSVAPVEKSVNLEKAETKALKKGLKAVEKRLAEIQEAGPPGMTRASAALKLSSSTVGNDPFLWQIHKQNATGEAEHNVRPRYATPSEQALAELIRGLKASMPGRKMSESEWRKWALRTQQHRPPQTQPLVGYRL
jgi:hypothetical protein